MAQSNFNGVCTVRREELLELADIVEKSNARDSNFEWVKRVANGIQAQVDELLAEKKGTDISITNDERVKYKELFTLIAFFFLDENINNCTSSVWFILILYVLNSCDNKTYNRTSIDKVNEKIDHRTLTEFIYYNHEIKYSWAEEQIILHYQVLWHELSKLWLNPSLKRLNLDDLVQDGMDKRWISSLKRTRKRLLRQWQDLINPKTRSTLRPKSTFFQVTATELTELSDKIKTVNHPKPEINNKLIAILGQIKSIQEQGGNCEKYDITKSIETQYPLLYLLLVFFYNKEDINNIPTVAWIALILIIQRAIDESQMSKESQTVGDEVEAKETKTAKIRKELSPKHLEALIYGLPNERTTRHDAYDMLVASWLLNYLKKHWIIDPSYETRAESCIRKVRELLGISPDDWKRFLDSFPFWKWNTVTEHQDDEEEI